MGRILRALIGEITHFKKLIVGTKPIAVADSEAAASDGEEDADPTFWNGHRKAYSRDC
jgi:hypothetical protein